MASPIWLRLQYLAKFFIGIKPTEIKDERTNEIQYKQKFKADKLQKSYQQLADSFVLPKDKYKKHAKT